MIINESIALSDQRVVYPPNNHKILYLQCLTTTAGHGILKRSPGYPNTNLILLKLTRPAACGMCYDNFGRQHANSEM
jgi:hypothetical protein